MDNWEIKLDGRTVCQAHMPLLGYPVQLILDQMAHGYTLYLNGRKVSKKELSQYGT